jgi:catechol 2,3-dioxygenase-like lactoylglutathione lyase family enzyme
VGRLRYVHHTGLTVGDIDRSIAFYQDKLGLELITTQETDGGYVAAIVGYPGARVRKAYLRLPGDDHILELFEYLAPAGQHLNVESKNVGAPHVCFVVEDLHELHQHLIATGVDSFVSEPVYVDVGPSEGGWALYLRDPDDIRVELFQLGPHSVADLDTAGAGAAPHPRASA